MDKGGQHVGPSVGTFARLIQENRDLKARVETLETEMGRRHRVDTDTIEKLKDSLAWDGLKLENLRELQVAAEAIEGPGDWFHKDIRPAIVALQKAIRKVRGMG